MNEVEIIAVAMVPAIAGLFKLIKFVQEGEKGIRLRFGKAVRDKDGKPVVIEPGFVLMIPFVEKLQRHHVRQQTLRLFDQKVMIVNGLIFNISAIIIFRVKDIYKALFEIHELDHSLVDLAMGLLRDELAHKTYKELSEIETISSGLLERLKGKAEEWGVEFIQFKLTDCAPTQETAPLINAAQGVNLKVDALTQAAEKIGVKLSQLNPVLAAALIGIPMVTSVSAQIHTNNGSAPKGNGLLAKILGDGGTEEGAES